MGLDSFAVQRKDGKLVELTEEQEKLFDGIQLCGGMFSGNGCGGSFRGKVYATFIEDLSEVSLYSEELENCEITSIIEGLDYFIKNSCESDKTDAINLLKFFKVCDENDLTVSGWW